MSAVNKGSIEMHKHVNKIRPSVRPSEQRSAHPTCYLLALSQMTVQYCDGGYKQPRRTKPAL